MTLEVFQREGILSDSESLEKNFLPALLRANIGRHHVASLGSVSRYENIKNFLRLKNVNFPLLMWNIPCEECSRSRILNYFTLKKKSHALWHGLLLSSYTFIRKYTFCLIINICSSTFATLIFFYLNLLISYFLSHVFIILVLLSFFQLFSTSIRAWNPSIMEDLSSIITDAFPSMAGYFLGIQRSKIPSNQINESVLIYIRDNNLYFYSIQSIRKRLIIIFFRLIFSIVLIVMMLIYFMSWNSIDVADVYGIIIKLTEKIWNKNINFLFFCFLTAFLFFEIVWILLRLSEITSNWWIEIPGAIVCCCSNETEQSQA